MRPLPGRFVDVAGPGPEEEAAVGLLRGHDVVGHPHGRRQVARFGGRLVQRGAGPGCLPHVVGEAGVAVEQVEHLAGGDQVVVPAGGAVQGGQEGDDVADVPVRVATLRVVAPQRRAAPPRHVRSAVVVRDRLVAPRVPDRQVAVGRIRLHPVQAQQEPAGPLRVLQMAGGEQGDAAVSGHRGVDQVRCPGAVADAPARVLEANERPGHGHGKVAPPPDRGAADQVGIDVEVADVGERLDSDRSGGGEKRAPDEVQAAIGAAPVVG